MKYIAIAFLAMFLIVSCTSTQKPNEIKETSQPSLTGSSWKLADNVKGKVPTIVFEEGKVSGNSGCNSFFGATNAITNNGSLVFDKIGTTRMMCGSEEMETENSFLAMLSKVNKYKISGETLELYQDNLLLLKFNKIL